MAPRVKKSRARLNYSDSSDSRRSVRNPVHCAKTGTSRPAFCAAPKRLGAGLRIFAVSNINIGGRKGVIRLARGLARAFEELADFVPTIYVVLRLT